MHQDLNDDPTSGDPYCGAGKDAGRARRKCCHVDARRELWTCNREYDVVNIWSSMENIRR